MAGEDFFFEIRVGSAAKLLRLIMVFNVYEYAPFSSVGCKMLCKFVEIRCNNKNTIKAMFTIAYLSFVSCYAMTKRPE